MNNVIRSISGRNRSRIMGGVVASPLIALAAMYWKAIGMKGGRFAWAAGPVLWLTLIAVVAGFAGGIYLASARRSAWWLLVPLVSVVLGYIQMQVVIVSGMASMR
jgi:hypothetical protein